MLQWSAQALANPDVIRARAWYEDRTGSLTLEQVQSQPFTPYEGVLSRGYGPSTFWVRLLIAGHHDDPGAHQDLDRRLPPTPRVAWWRWWVPSSTPEGV